jgi:hypothetical protein
MCCNCCLRCYEKQVPLAFIPSIAYPIFPSLILHSAFIMDMKNGDEFIHEEQNDDDVRMCAYCVRLKMIPSKTTVSSSTRTIC